MARNSLILFCNSPLLGSQLKMKKGTERGGYHVDPPKPLPKDLQEILDNAKHGVILFSMGSNLKSANIPQWKKNVILKVLAKLKQTVLWKFEEDLPGKPDNVVIRNWLPQTDILAHPNVKLFITHGGMLSSIETVYHGVPVLTIPVFGDQFSNADRAVRFGYALQIPFKDDNQWTEENLYQLIQKLITDPKYSLTAKKVSKIFHDRPMTPLQTMVYWVEYVIRHNGADHLRVAGVGMPFWQYFLLDVLGAILGIILASLYVVYYVVKKLCCKKTVEPKQSKSKKVKKS